MEHACKALDTSCRRDHERDDRSVPESTDPANAKQIKNIRRHRCDLGRRG
jgi:hypothetical protein